MQGIRIRDIILGENGPKIAVSVIGHSRQDIIDHAKLILSEAERLEEEYKESGIRLSILEFRADYYDDVSIRTELLGLLQELRDMAGSSRLILFTYRSEEEGGELRHDRAGSMLADIYEWVITSRLVDMVDIEVMSGNYRVVRAAAKAHEAYIRTVMSYHDFEETPHNDKLIEIFRNMEILGGDILKIAVKPKNEFDVRRMEELLSGIRLQHLSYGNVQQPVVLISMGELGERTRTMHGECYSAFTFASVGKESAPGQVSLEKMFKELGS